MGSKIKEIKLNKGFITLVDEDDFEYLNQWKWYVCKKPNGYYVRRSEGPAGKQKYIYMHRVILNVPDGMFTDHMDHNPLNNQKSNIRVCTKRQNALNRIPSNPTKLLGVSIERGKYKSRIRAAIKSNGITKHLGTFKNVIDAAIAYDNAAKEMFGQFANLNFK